MSIEDNRYLIRRKVLTVLGQKFHVYDGHGKLIGFSKQKAFKLKEDIRFYSDETMEQEKLLIQARQVIDFAAAYDVVDSQSQQKIGVCRRKGWTSMVRDSWEILDEHDNPVAKVSEDSMLLATLRRFFSNLIPQHYQITDNAGRSRRSCASASIPSSIRWRWKSSRAPPYTAESFSPQASCLPPSRVASDSVLSHMIHVDCEQCGKPFEVADTLAGGLTNCPDCGKATPVPGLRDPCFRLIQIGMAIGWALLTTFGWITGGWSGAFLLGIGSALGLGLVYISL